MKAINGTRKRLMTGAQIKYLSARLDSAKRERSYAIQGLGREEMPAHILKAEAMVERWRKENHRRRDKVQSAARARLSKEYDAARRAVLFGTPDEALAVVGRFEQTTTTEKD